jgi:hypothetical protein
MAISAIQGTPGSGKSAFAVSMALDHLRSGGVVAANFSLVDGWALEVARRSFKVRWLGFDVHKYARDLHDRFRVVGSLEGVYQATKELIPKAKGKISKQYEDHGLLLIDESQLIFNSRAWQKNMPWIEFFSQHRKHKWTVLLISHSVEMIDTQVRNFIEYDIRFRNMNKVKLPIIKIPVSSLFLADNLFLGIHKYYGLGAGSGNIFKRDLTKLCMWEAMLYDSMKVFSQVQHCPEYSESGAVPALPEVPPIVSYIPLHHFIRDVSYLKSDHPVTVLQNAS